MQQLRRSFKYWRVTLGLVAALAVGSAGPVFAADTVTQVLTAGTRSASVANLTLSPAAYSHSDQSNTGAMTLSADDSTGSGLGWNVTIQSSAFVYSGTNGGTNIPAANFAITTANAPSRTAGQSVDAVGGPKVPLTGSTGTLDTAHKTVQALPTFGMGAYSQAIDVSLTIPGGSRVGTYTGTLTTTIAAAP